MALISLKDFYKDKENKDISMYFDYLKEEKKEIEDAVSASIEFLGEGNELVENLKQQLSFIDQLEAIIKSSGNELLADSIEKMNVQELIEIVSKYLRKKINKKVEIFENINDLKNKKEILESKMSNSLELEGYKDSYYAANDTEVFFSDNLGDEDFVFKLVNSSQEPSELKNLFSSLFNSQECDQLTKAIVNLGKIAKFADEKVTKKAISAFLSPEKIGTIIGANDKTNIEGNFSTLQNLLKMKTDFFISLPDKLKQSLVSSGEVPKSETYYKLRDIYDSYKANGKVVLPKSKEIETLNAGIANEEEKLADIEKEISAANNIILDRELMENFIVGIIGKDSEASKYTVSSIKEASQVDTMLPSKIQILEDELIDLQNKRQKVEDVIFHSSKNFAILNAREDNQSIRDLEEKFDLLIRNERKKLACFEIVGNTINELRRLSGLIEDNKLNTNLLRSINGEKRKQEIAFKEEYAKVIYDCYNKLASRDLLDSKVADPVSNFKSVFDNLKKSMSVLTKECPKKDLSNLGIGGCDIFHRVDFLVGNIPFLANKLLSVSQKNNELYDFEISDASINDLINNQKEILNLYLKAYGLVNDRLNDNEEMGKRPFSRDFNELANLLDIPGEEMTKSYLSETRQDLSKRIDDIEQQIADLKMKENNSVFQDIAPEDVQAYNEILVGFDQVSLDKTTIEGKMSL